MVDVTELQIVDGMGDGSVVGVTLKTFDPPVSGDVEFAGSFGASEVNSAVAGDLDELAGHICMGHIYAAAKMENGQILMGKIRYVPEEGSTLTCEEAVPGDHSGHSSDATKPSSSAIALNAASRRGIATVLAVVFFMFLS